MPVFNNAVNPAGTGSLPSRLFLKRLAVTLGLFALLAAALYFLFSGLTYHWNWKVVYEYRILFIRGFFTTIYVSIGAMVLGLLVGLAAGLARISRNMIIREASTIYVEIFRGTPLLVQIYIFYFCVAAAINFDNAPIIGMVTLAFFSGAYITEMVRAGIESIDPGQWEAALATGLSYRQTLIRIILPQAIRRIIPPVTGQFVSLIKDSSLLSVISVSELTKAAEIINATTYKTFEAYLPLALFYLVLTYPLTKLTYLLEAKLNNQTPHPTN